MKVTVKDARLSFPVLFKAEQVNGQGIPKFGGSLIIPPGHPAHQEVQAAIDTVGRAKWADKWPAIKKQMEEQDKTCLHNGDTKAYDGYAGNYFISTSSKQRPLAIDRARNPVSEEDGVLYSGCYVNAQIQLWAQDNKFGKRVNAQLLGVQFNRDGDAFAAGGRAAVADFEDLSMGEEEEEESLV